MPPKVKSGTGVPKQHSSQRLSASTGIIKIPVVVHVIHNQQNNAVGVGNNISKAQIESQIRVLNEDFRRKINTRGYNTNPVGADTEIEFHLAYTDTNCMPFDGITRSYYMRDNLHIFDDENLIKSIDYFPTNQYLNIWVCSLTSKYLGGAQFPEGSGLIGLQDETFFEKKDGIIISSRAFGDQMGTANTGNYKYGRTTTHEIGHWLGLLHTWGDQDCGDDHCSDTPTVLDPNYGDCSQRITNCNNKQTVAMIENYLDYSRDICMNIFTNDQKQRMRTALVNSPRRAALTTSPGQNQFDIKQLPFQSDFSGFNKLSDLGWEQNTSLLQWNKSADNIFINCANISTTGISNILKTPFFALPTTNQINPVVTITFMLKYPNITKTDSVVISLYNGCKKPKTFLKSIFGNNLTSADTFKLHTITLLGSQNLKHIKLEIETFSKGKSDIYLDNFSVNIPPLITDLNTKSQDGTHPLKAKYDNKNSNLVAFIQTIDTTNFTFELMDMLGQKVEISNQSYQSSNQYTMNVTNFSSGIYLLVARSNTHIYTTKVLLLRE